MNATPTPRSTKSSPAIITSPSESCTRLLLKFLKKTVLPNSGIIFVALRTVPPLRTMKRALLTFHFMFFVPIIAFLHAQERPFIPDSLRILLQNDSLHITRPASLAPWIGEEIDQSEKAEYGLFRWLDDASFMSAKIFHTSDTSLVIAIYLWDGQTQVKHISPYRFQQMQWHVCDIYYSKHPMEDTLRKYSMTSAEVYTLRYTAEDPDGYSYDSPAVQFWPIGSDDHIACPYYTDFLYLHAQVGDRFAVCYRNDKPGDFEMYTNEPLLDPDDPDRKR